MNYQIEIKPRAFKDLRGLPKAQANRILDAVEALHDNLAGDVKKLTNHTPEYRLRVGDYRILFEVESDIIVVYRITHRKNAYN